jgi:hypothetical protein
LQKTFAFAILKDASFQVIYQRGAYLKAAAEWTAAVCGKYLVQVFTIGSATLIGISIIFLSLPVAVTL